MQRKTVYRWRLILVTSLLILCLIVQLYSISYYITIVNFWPISTDNIQLILSSISYVLTTFSLLVILSEIFISKMEIDDIMPPARESPEDEMLIDYTEDIQESQIENEETKERIIESDLHISEEHPKEEAARNTTKISDEPFNIGLNNDELVIDLEEELDKEYSEFPENEIDASEHIDEEISTTKSIGLSKSSPLNEDKIHLEMEKEEKSDLESTIEGFNELLKKLRDKH